MDWHTIQTSAPAAITAFLGIVGTLVAGVVKLAKMWRAAKDALMQSTPPVAPAALPAPPRTPSGPFTSAETTGRFLEAHAAVVMRSEWVVAELRDELRECRAEKEQLAQDAQRTAAALVARERELNSALAKHATLMQAEEHWRNEAARLERECERLRAQQRTERVNPETLKTPLRPRPLKGST